MNLAQQAGLWLQLTRACNRALDYDQAHRERVSPHGEGVIDTYRIDPDYAEAKAVEMVEYSLRSLELRTKLTALSSRTDEIDRLRLAGRLDYRRTLELSAHNHGVSFHTTEGDFVGRAQTKHARWLRALLPYGVTATVLSVTGLERATRGVNVRLSIGPALDGLYEQGQTLQRQLVVAPGLPAVSPLGEVLSDEGARVLIDPYEVLDRSGLRPEDLPVTTGIGTPRGELQLVPATGAAPDGPVQTLPGAGNPPGPTPTEAPPRQAAAPVAGTQAYLVVTSLPVSVVERVLPGARVYTADHLASL